MVAIYPIRATREYYRGSDQRRQRKVADFNRVCAEIERAVNAHVAAEPPGEYVYMYYEIARWTGYTEEQVRRALQVIDGGSGGITIEKRSPDTSREAAS